MSRLANAQGTTVRNGRDLRAALHEARPGARIVMAGGEWRDLDLVVDVEGAEDAPVTVCAETPGKVILKGRSRLRIGGQHCVVDGLRFERAVDLGEVIAFRSSTSRLARHCRVTRCAVVDCAPVDPEANTKWLSLYGEANRVDHCYFSGKKNLGTTLVVWLRAGTPPNHHQIDHNYFGYRPPLGQNGGETIRVGDSATSMLESRTQVVSNYFHRCNGEVEIISNKSCFNDYLNNTFEECEGALTLRHGNDCRVEANWFLGNNQPNTGGVRIIGERHRVVNNYFADLTGSDSRAACSMMNGLVDSPLNGYFQVKEALVAFNTFVNCAEPFVIGLHLRDDAVLPPRGVVMASNVSVSSRGEAVRMADARSKVSWKANFLERDADLGLLRTDDGIWRPVPGSAVVGAGVDAGVGKDIDGQRRSGRFDAGCDQISDEPPTWRLVRLEKEP